MRSGRVVPLLAVLLLAAPGCEVTRAIFEPASIALPPEESALVRADLAVPPEAATDEQVLASVRKVLDPLPVDSARYANGEFRVVLGALSDQVLDAVTGSGSAITTGGWIGILIAGVSTSAGIVALAMKKASLVRRSKVTPPVVVTLHDERPGVAPAVNP